MNRGFWRGRRVFVTGHTGFKGGWLDLLITTTLVEPGPPSCTSWQAAPLPLIGQTSIVTGVAPAVIVAVTVRFVASAGT